MTRLPILSGQQVISALEKAGFVILRQKGSHIRLKHADGRVVTVPVHGGIDLGRGLLRKILRDSELSVDELMEFLN